MSTSKVAAHWQWFWKKAPLEKMDKNLHDLFKYSMGQKMDLAPWIADMETVKYGKSFQDLGNLLRLCVLEWAQTINAPLLERGSLACEFAVQWHHLLTSPGLMAFRDDQRAETAVAELSRIVSQVDRTQSKTNAAVQQWMHDTLVHAPQHWTEVMDAAFSLWEKASPEQQKAVNPDWAVHYGLCSDKDVFLAHVCKTRVASDVGYAPADAPSGP